MASPPPARRAAGEPAGERACLPPPARPPASSRRSIKDAPPAFFRTRKEDHAWREAQRIASHAVSEANIQRLLARAITSDMDNVNKPGTELSRIDALSRKRLMKAGFEDEGLISHHLLLRLTSLMRGLHTVQNRDTWQVHGRRELRLQSPMEPQARIAGKYEVTTYFAERMRRHADEEQGQLHKGRSVATQDAWMAALHVPSPDLPNRGFHESFVRMIVGLSVLPTPRIASLAANDFLRHPLQMMAIYLETAGGAIALAKSGQLNLATSQRFFPIRALFASSGVRELAETLMLAPAACLDYFDAIYTKSDVDGEYAGFSPSGHLLRNEAILNRRDPEVARMPLVLTQPLSIIQIALKHDLKNFLAQPVVNFYMRKEWLGGGLSELLVDQSKLRQVVLAWCLGWPLIIPYNLVLMLISAVYPPFEEWYVRRRHFHRIQTHERALWGFPFLPCCIYVTSLIADLGLALAITFVEIMPFRIHGQPFFGGLVEVVFHEEADTIQVLTLIFLCFTILGAILEEWGILYTTLFSGIELGKIWKLVIEAITKTRISPRHFKGGDAIEPYRRLYFHLQEALAMTFQGISYVRMSNYLDRQCFELLTRVLCVCTLFFAFQFNEKDYSLTSLGLLDKEAIRSYTVMPVCCVWLRLLRSLRVFSVTGSFVYMLGQMMRDLIRWLIIYSFGILAFAASLVVLFRNNRAAVGRTYYTVEGDCSEMDDRIQSLLGGILLLIEVSLQGSSYWHCFGLSSAEAPSLLIFGVFLVIMILMLLNTLIAMMAETFSTVTNMSFRNYAYSFGRVLVSQRCRSTMPAPLNLLSLPYRLIIFALELLLTCKMPGVQYYGRLRMSHPRPRSPSNIRFSTQRDRAMSIMQECSSFGKKGMGHSRFNLKVYGMRSRQQADSSSAPNDSFREKIEVTHDGRDFEVVRRIDDIRLMLVQDKKKRAHFERSIAQFCRVQEDSDDPPTLDEIRELVRESLEEMMSKYVREAVDHSFQRHLSSFRSTVGSDGCAGSSESFQGEWDCSPWSSNQVKELEAMEADALEAQAAEAEEKAAWAEASLEKTAARVNALSHSLSSVDFPEKSSVVRERAKLKQSKSQSARRREPTKQGPPHGWMCS